MLGVMAICITAIWMVIDRFSNVDVNEPTPTRQSGSPAASPVPNIGSASSPEDSVALPRPGSLPDLLRYAPDRLADDSLPLTDVGRYADIQAWTAARGLALPSSIRDSTLPAWTAELENLALPTSLAERGLDPEWEDAYGFNLTQVHQVLIVGQAPDYVMILRGGFDPARLQDAWVSSGYQAVELEGTTIWTLFPGDTIDLSDPASRPAMGTLNNVVVLDDGTLVAAAKLSRLKSVLRVQNGNASSLAENASVASLLDSRADTESLVSAVISKGTLLESLPGDLPRSGAAPPPADQPLGTSLEQLLGAAIRNARMPEVDLVLIGILPPSRSGPNATPEPSSRGTAVAIQAPDPQLRLVLSFDDMDNARIARTVIDQRFHEDMSRVTNAAYGKRYGSTRIRLIDSPGDPALVEVAATLPGGAADWLLLLNDRDFGFAYWLSPPPPHDD